LVDLLKQTYIATHSPSVSFRSNHSLYRC